MPAFNCTSCHAKTWANDLYADRDGWCPDCRQRVAVPPILTTPYFKNPTRLRSQTPPPHIGSFSLGPDRLALHLFTLVHARVGNRAKIRKGSYGVECLSRNPGSGSRAVIAKFVIHEAGLPGAVTGIGTEVQVWVRTTGDAESPNGCKAIRRVWNPIFQSVPVRSPLFARLDPARTLGPSPHEPKRFAFFPILFLTGRGFADIEALDETALGTISGTITEDLGPIVELLVASAGV